MNMDWVRHGVGDGRVVPKADARDLPHPKPPVDCHVLAPPLVGEGSNLRPHLLKAMKKAARTTPRCEARVPACATARRARSLNLCSAADTSTEQSASLRSASFAHPGNLPSRLPGRKDVARAEGTGLTKTDNALKDPLCDEPRIVVLHDDMDRAVLDAYGWTDIAVPPFCPMNPDEERDLQQFKDTVIDRLFVLNAERAAEEKRLGVAKPGEKPSRDRSGTKRARKATNQPKLIEDGDE